MFATWLLLVIYLAFISLGLPDALLGAAWPAMYGELGVEASAAGLISMIIAGATIVSTLFSDRVIRRYGTGKVTLVSVLLTALGLLGFSFAGAYVWLCLLALPLGLGAGSVDAGLNNYVALHFKARHMSWLHSFWGVGAMTGPLVLSAAIRRFGAWQNGYRLVSALQFGLVALLLLSLPLWGKMSSGESGAKAAPQKALSMAGRLRLPGAKAALLSFFSYCAIESTAGLWASSFMVHTRGISPVLAAEWTSLYYAGITAGRFICGFLTLRLSNRRMIQLGLFIMLGGVLLMLAPLGETLLLVGFFLLGLGCAPIFPSLLHETPRHFGAEYSQALMGTQMAAAYGGVTLAPPIFGLLAAGLGFALLPYFLAAFFALMWWMILRLRRQTQGRPV